MKYLYKCNTCLHEFEKEQKLVHMVNAAKQPKVKCPVCKGSTRKIINSTPIHFKGNGWGKDKE
jgi:putative FmdB family regulatory protein